MFVEKRMTSNPITVSSVTTVADASELMRNHKFRRLPVVDAGKLVGIVTDRDLRSVSSSPATTLSIFELNYLLAKMMIKDIMQKKVITIHKDATIEEAALLMFNHRIGGLVVLDDNNGVVGIITETDIFKTFVDVMGLPSGTTRLTVEMEDKVGAIHGITGVFTELGINIGSLVSCSLEDGKAEVIIRTNITDTQEVVEKLAAKGYTVTHIVQIG